MPESDGNQHCNYVGGNWCRTRAACPGVPNTYKGETGIVPAVSERLEEVRSA